MSSSNKGWFARVAGTVAAGLLALATGGPSYGLAAAVSIEITAAAGAPSPNPVSVDQEAEASLNASVTDPVFKNNESIIESAQWKWKVVEVQLLDASTKAWDKDPGWDPDPTKSADKVTVTAAGGTPPDKSAAVLHAKFPTPGKRRMVIRVTGDFTGTDQNHHQAQWHGEAFVFVVLVVDDSPLTFVRLYIDSDNNNGRCDPDKSEVEEKLKKDPKAPGKFVIVNQNDDNKNGVPDYADFQVTGEENFVPFLLAVDGKNLDWKKVQIKFTFPGVDTLDPADFDGVPIPGGPFKDYTKAKQKSLRVWNVPSPNADRSPVDKKITAYVRPGHAYTADELGIKKAQDTRFYIEGINSDPDPNGPQGQKPEVAVEVTYVNNGQPVGNPRTDAFFVNVVEPNLGVNNSNYFAGDPAGRPLRVGTPDVDFFIDEHLENGNLVREVRTPQNGKAFAHDELVEDQGEGFVFWWSRNRDDTKANAKEIPDFAPLVVDIPKSLVDNDFQYFLRIEVDPKVKPDDYPTLFVVKAASTAKNRRAFLQSEDGFKDQDELINKQPDNGRTLKVNDDINVTNIILANKDGKYGVNGRHEFLFKADGPQTKEMTIYLKLIVQKAAAKPNGGNQKPDCTLSCADQVKITMKPVEHLVSLYSLREPGKDDKPLPPVNPTPTPLPQQFYPIDDEYIQIDEFPDAGIVFDHRVADRKTQCVFLHGYNVDLVEAKKELNEVYQRLFWLGYRGNVLGVTWQGNPRNKFHFNEPIEIAARSSVPLRRFLQFARDKWADGNPDNVEIMAHSLGNLLMWDAVRVHARYVEDENNAKYKKFKDQVTQLVDKKKLAHNILSVQAAIWQEAFEAENDLVYQQKAAKYEADAANDVITYNTGDEKLMTWRFWFRQNNASIVDDSLSGQAYNSYLDGDFVLGPKILELFEYENYALDLGRLRLRPWQHYHRDRVFPANPNTTRRPATVGREHHFDIPTLMNSRTAPPYKESRLNHAIGRMKNPLSKYNYEASDGGWRAKPAPAIIRFFRDDGFNHSDFVVIPLPSIYPWYRQFLGGGTQQNNAEFPSGIPLGNELGVK